MNNNNINRERTLKTDPVNAPANKYNVTAYNNTVGPSPDSREANCEL
jgi:hypothetical protein